MAAASVDRPVRSLPPPPRAPQPTGTAPLAEADRPPAWRRPLLVAAGISAATAAVVVLDPTRRHLFPPCPFHVITGLDCPLCGGTRAVNALAHLDLATAASQHLLVTVLAPIVALVVVAWLVVSFVPDRARAVRERLPLLATVVTWTAAAFVAFGVLRVLPIDQLRWLRTG